jgi:hypothetical protein
MRPPYPSNATSVRSCTCLCQTGIYKKQALEHKSSCLLQSTQFSITYGMYIRVCVCVCVSPCVCVCPLVCVCVCVCVCVQRSRASVQPNIEYRQMIATIVGHPTLVCCSYSVGPFNTGTSIQTTSWLKKRFQQKSQAKRMWCGIWSRVKANALTMPCFDDDHHHDDDNDG